MAKDQRVTTFFHVKIVGGYGFTVTFARYFAKIELSLLSTTLPSFCRKPYNLSICQNLHLSRRGSSSVYAALYFLPALALAHAVLGGLVYVAYPHLVLVLSLVSCAAHFAYKLDQSSKALLWGCVKDSRNLVILLGG